LEDSGLLVERVVSVLEFMRSNDINLTILLWAISWNVKELTGHSLASYERTSLMLSDELPQILRNWLKPPRQHSAGIRTKAANESIRESALGIVCDAIDNEMKGLKTIFKSSSLNVSKESLLDFEVTKMISEVSNSAPTVWRLFRHASYTPKQNTRNTFKSPDSVSELSLYIDAC